MTYKYKPGDDINGRIVLACLESGGTNKYNLYKIRYHCCEREAEVLEHSLDRARRRKEPPKPCRWCARQKYVMAVVDEVVVKVEQVPDSPPLFASLPAPPSTSREWKMR